MTSSILGGVYKITSCQTTDVYIGSTTCGLESRFSTHKGKYVRYITGKQHYVTSFDIIKYPDAKMELLFEGEFANRVDLRKAEGEYIRTVDNCINRCVAGRSRKEHYSDNKEKKLQYAKEYRETHKDENKKYHTAYYQCNRDKQLEKQKKYAANNKDRIKEWKTTKKICDVCGGTFTNSYKARHLKSKIHITAEAQKLQEPEENK